MENVFVLKTIGDVVTIPTLADLDLLPIGHLIAIGNGKTVIGNGSAAADISGIDSIQFMTKEANGKFKTSVSIKRNEINYYNKQVATNAVNPVITLGGVSALYGFVIPTTGEGVLLIQNMSYNHAISSQRVTHSSTKLASETPTTYIDRVVASLNVAANKSPTPFFTAAKVTATVSGIVYLGITITAISAHIDLNVSMDGIFLGASKRTTTQAVIPMGAGTDVVAMEKDSNRFRGDANYVEMNDAFYSQSLTAVATLKYDIHSLRWSGIAPTPTNSIKVANNTIQCAFDTTTGGAEVDAFFALILGTTYQPTGGTTSAGAAGDTNATDNI